MNDHELDLALADMGVRHANVQVPAALRQRVSQVPATTSPHRGFLPHITGRLQSMFSATKFVVAGAIVALFGGFLVAGFLTTQPSDDRLPAVGASASATSEPSPTESPADDRSTQRLDYGPFLPAVLPKGADWGGSGSGLATGQSRWVHITGDPKTLPFMEQVLPGPDGLLLFDTGGGAHPCSTVPKRIRASDRSRGYCQNGPDLWRSDDALTWEPLKLPVKAHVASMTLLDGTYWLATKDPTELWRSGDAEQWERVDLSALEPTGPRTLDWEAELGTPATSNGRTVVPVKYRALDAGRLLGQGELALAWPEPTETPGHYRVKVAYQTRIGNEGEVLIEEDDSGVVFTRPDGSLIARLDGVDLGFVEAWSRNHQIAERSFALIDDMAAVPASVAGSIPPAGPWKAEPPAVLATPDGFRAYLLDDRDGTIATWHSADGTTWAPGDAVSLDGPIEFVGSDGSVHGPRILAVGSGQLWRTEDGGTWEPTVLGAQRLPWGPADIEFRTDRNVLEISVEDTTGQVGTKGEWYPLVIPGLTWDPEAGDPDGIRIATLGDTIFLWIGYHDGLVDRHLWVIERWEPTDG